MVQNPIILISSVSLKPKESTYTYNAISTKKSHTKKLSIKYLIKTREITSYGSKVMALKSHAMALDLICRKNLKIMGKS